MSLKLIVLACLLAVAHSRVINIWQRNPLIGGRILGGHDAKPGDFPHQVSLQWGSQGQFQHFCGGSILNERWILTAVHCLEGIEAIKKLGYVGYFIVKAGKLDLNRVEDSEQTSIVEKYFKNAEYTGTAEIPGSSDIGLIKLETPLRLNKRVTKIALPQKDSEPTGNTILSGWGAIDDGGKNAGFPNILQTIDLPIISRENCKQAIENIMPGSGDNVDETNICTGPLNGGQSPCNGDSGGPLIKKDDKGQTQVIGIVSWGLSPCGSTGAPSVYVKVSHFIDWITDIITKN